MQLMFIDIPEEKTLLDMYKLSLLYIDRNVQDKHMSKFFKKQNKKVYRKYRRLLQGDNLCENNFRKMSFQQFKSEYKILTCIFRESTEYLSEIAYVDNELQYRIRFTKFHRLYHNLRSFLISTCRKFTGKELLYYG